MNTFIAPLNKHLDAYNRLVEKDTGAWYSHDTRWLTLLECVTGVSVTGLFVERRGKIVGILPFLLTEDTAHVKILNSLPFFGSPGGILLADTDAQVLLGIMLDALDEYCEAAHIGAAMLNPGIFSRHSAAIASLWKPSFTEHRIGQITLLPTEEAALLPLFHKSKRQAVRKAGITGITLRKAASESDWQWFQHMHSQRMAAIGGLAKPSAFFKWAQTEPEFITLFMAELDNRLCAGLLVCHFQTRDEYLVPVFSPEKAGNSAMSLLVFWAMRRGIQRGATHFSFGGTWLDQTGVYRYKSQFGTSDHPYAFYGKIYDATLFEMTRAQLLSRYPWFFVMPFSLLETT